jgi:hypothetical protein
MPKHGGIYARAYGLDGPGQHEREIAGYLSGARREPQEVLLAFDDQNRALGFIELSIRAYAEGCTSSRVAFIEGWYVEPSLLSEIGAQRLVGLMGAARRSKRSSPIR